MTWADEKMEELAWKLAMKGKDNWTHDDWQNFKDYIIYKVTSESEVTRE